MRFGHDTTDSVPILVSCVFCNVCVVSNTCRTSIRHFCFSVNFAQQIFCTWLQLKNFFRLTIISQDIKRVDQLDATLYKELPVVSLLKRISCRDIFMLNLSNHLSSGLLKEIRSKGILLCFILLLYLHKFCSVSLTLLVSSERPFLL